MGKRSMEKKNLVMLDIIATNNWRRPIYFSSTVSTSDYMNLEPYFQLEGMAYRLLPFKNPIYAQDQEEGYVPTDLNHKQLLHEFAYRGLNDKTIFYDENSLRYPSYYRDKFARLANAYLAKGNAAKAKEVADYCLQVMPPDTVPYDSFSPLLAPALLAGGERQRANVLLDTTLHEATQSLDYYAARPDAALFDFTRNLNLMQVQNVYRAAAQMQDTVRAQRALAVLQPYMQRR
jgi:tetratricopeptide (TPR) repeat protein